MAVRPGGPGDAGTSSAGSTVKQAVSRLLANCGLDVRESAHELVISNPRDPEKGQIYIAYEDAYVSWERVTWEYLGCLEGASDSTDGDVPVERIIAALTGEPSRM